MRVPDASPASTTTDLQKSSAEVRVSGRWLFIARVACVSVALLAFIIWSWGVPFRYAQLGTVCTVSPCGDQQPTPASLAAFRAAGMTLGFYAAYTGTLEVLFTLVFLLIAAVVFWRKSDTRIGLVTALCLVTFGVNQTSADALATAIPAFAIPVNLLQPLSYILLALFLYLFPDGQFIPRWTGFVLLAWIPLFLMSVAVLPVGVFVPLLFVFILMSLSVQIYRFRRVSTSMQRQQTKWVVFGTLISTLGSVGILTTANVLKLSQSPGTWGFLVGNTLLYLFSALIPLSIGVAIVRSKLWDIDVLIKKALVYGVLTALLAAVYAGLIISLQFLLGGIIKQNNGVVIVVSTLVIAALFLPLRRRIQQIIDRRFYRRKYDAAKTVETFSATLRHEVDLTQLSEHLITVVQETMQPTHVWLWLRPPAHDGTHRAPWRVTPPISSQGNEEV
jgi:hypothetical protein